MASLSLYLTHILLFILFNNKFISPSLSFRSSSTYSSTYPSSSSSVSYTQHCNSIVSKSNPNSLLTSESTFPHLETAFFTGGADNSSNTAFLFRTQSVYKTDSDGVVMVQASLIFRAGNTLPFRTVGRFRTRGPRIPIWRRRLTFSLNGFWSESSGKLCMVGTGTAYSKEGDVLDLFAVFKLTFPKKSTIFTSFVTGSLESVDDSSSVNYFEPITVLAFSQRDYVYTLVSQEKASELPQGTEFQKDSALASEGGTSICSKLVSSGGYYELEYGNDCFGTKNCSPLDGGIGVLPELMFFSDVQCSDEQKLRLLIGFSNGSYSPYYQPLVLERMLIGEGFWDQDNNRLRLVGCRVLNSTDSLLSASVGDCSVRLSLWFPAIMSIKNRSHIVGQIWSNKTMNGSGYFDKLVFRSPKNSISVVAGLKYKYTETDKVAMVCANETSKKKGAAYPSGYSYDMSFNMRVKSNRGVHVWGYAVPLSVGDQFYGHSMEITSYAMGPHDTLFQMKENLTSLLNISYRIQLTPDYQFGGTNSSLNASLNLNAPVEISAEGIYNSETGNLCMVGCRDIKLSKSRSLDCEILVNIQFSPLDSEESVYAKGTIKSKRGNSDPLYFEGLQLSAISLTSTQAKESIWRMDFEITMVLVSNTLICIFVGLQIFYVKKHPVVLHSISFVMLVILTLGQMIPLVLNFEAMFLTNRNRQTVVMDNGGWLEVNEVLVRVVTMVSFLFQFRLLQVTWSSKSGDENQKSLVIAEKKALYVLLPLYLVGAFVAWGIHWWDHKQHSLWWDHKQHSLWWDLRSYAGLLLDGFLLPQILFNLFWNSKDKALCPAFYLGITSVHLLPHAYDLYRAHRYVDYLDASYIYADPGGDFYSTAWDVIIPCGGLLLAFVIYLQQRFGGSCLLPPPYRPSVSYEKVPVVSSELAVNDWNEGL